MGSDFLAPAPRRLSTGWRQSRGLLWQAALLLAIAAFLATLALTAQSSIHRLGLQFGFGFLEKTAGFRIGESLLPYSAADTYTWALLVGLTNTLRVALIACVAALVLGVLVGVARLSSNPVLARISAAYVEGLRNIPLVLQLVLWHALVLRLPPVNQALSPLPGLFLSQRGLHLSFFQVDRGFWIACLGVVLGIVVAVACWRPLARAGLWRWAFAALFVFGLPLVLLLATGSSLAWSTPVLRGFNFLGGVALTPEFAAVLFGLTVYASAFIAEIVRGAIRSVSAGQWEAAQALGLDRGRTLRLIVIPQAMRIALPPMISQFLNLIKNSSLGIVVGFPEFATITNTVINQTGQAIEVLAIFMGVYLILSLAISAVLNAYNLHLSTRDRSA